MQADTHPNHARGTSARCTATAAATASLALLEADEERVPLGIHLASTMSLEHLTQHATVLRTQVTVCSTVPP